MSNWNQVCYNVFILKDFPITRFSAVESGTLWLLPFWEKISFFEQSKIPSFRSFTIENRAVQSIKPYYMPIIIELFTSKPINWLVHAKTMLFSSCFKKILKLYKWSWKNWLFNTTCRFAHFNFTNYVVKSSACWISRFHLYFFVILKQLQKDSNFKFE